jgi:hypothetical protein
MMRESSRLYYSGWKSAIEAVGRRILPSVLIMLAECVSASAMADMGVWSPSGDATKVTPLGLCRQTYVCSPRNAQMYDPDKHRLVVTAPQATTGGCMMGADPTSCDRCSAGPPSTPCEWHLEAIQNNSKSSNDGCHDDACRRACRARYPNNFDAFNRCIWQTRQ